MSDQVLERLAARLRKKKLLRRTPYADIGDEYTRLMKDMKRDLVDDKSSHPYIALCYLAVSRCYEALGRTGKSASRVAHAGASLMSHRLGSESSDAVWEDFVPDAIECYLRAARTHRAQGRRVTASALLAELGNALMYITDRKSEASVYLQESVKDMYDPYISSPLLGIERLQKALACEIDIGEYRKASSVCEWIITIALDLPDLRTLEDAHNVTINTLQGANADGDARAAELATARAARQAGGGDDAAAAAVRAEQRRARAQRLQRAQRAAASDDALPTFPVFADALLRARITHVLLLCVQGANERAAQQVSKLLSDHANNALGDDAMLGIDFDLSLDVHATSPSQLISLLHNLVAVCAARDVQVFAEIQTLLMSVLTDTQARICDQILINMRL